METMSQDISQIAVALAKVQGLLGPIYKGETAKVGSYSYKYASLTEIWEQIRSILSKNELSVVQSFVQDPSGSNTFLETMLLHASGQWIKSRLPLGRHDKIQVLGSEITYLRRYGLSPLLGIVTDEDEDGCMANSEEKEPKKKKEEPVSAVKHRLYNNFDKSLHTQLNLYLEEIAQEGKKPLDVVIEMALSNVLRFSDSFNKWVVKSAPVNKAT
jgi:hypothetical protein